MDNRIQAVETQLVLIDTLGPATLQDHFVK